MKRRMLGTFVPWMGLAASIFFTPPAHGTVDGPDARPPAPLKADARSVELARMLFPAPVMLDKAKQAFAVVVRQAAMQPRSRLGEIEARDPGFVDALIERTAPLYLADVEPRLEPLWTQVGGQLQQVLTRREIARSLDFYRSPTGERFRAEVKRLAGVQMIAPAADAKGVADGASDLSARAYANLSSNDRKIADAYLKEVAGEHRDAMVALSAIQLDWLRHLPSPAVSQPFKEATITLIRERASSRR